MMVEVVLCHFVSYRVGYRCSDMPFNFRHVVRIYKYEISLKKNWKLFS